MQSRRYHCTQQDILTLIRAATNINERLLMLYFMLSQLSRCLCVTYFFVVVVEIDTERYILNYFVRLNCALYVTRNVSLEEKNMLQLIELN